MFQSHRKSSPNIDWQYLVDHEADIVPLHLLDVVASVNHALVSLQRCTWAHDFSVGARWRVRGQDNASIQPISFDESLDCGLSDFVPEKQACDTDAAEGKPYFQISDTLPKWKIALV